MRNRWDEPERSGHNARLVTLLLMLAGLGFAARVGLIGISEGSYDTLLWGRIGATAAAHGLLRAYDDVDCNQPPGQPVIAMMAHRLSVATGVRFSVFFKAPLLAADAIVAVVLWRLLARRRGPRFAAVTVALYAWSPVSILATGYHGNLDPLYAGLALLAVYLVAEARRDLLGALVLGLAINIKGIPVLIVPPMLLSYHDNRRAARFFAGLAIMALPCVALMILIPQRFYQRVLLYNSWADLWGVNYFLVAAAHKPSLSAVFERLFDGYRDLGRYVVLATVLLVSLVTRRRRWVEQDLGLFRAALCALAVLLVVGQGFGLNYLVAVVPLLFAIDRWRAVAYSLAGGVMMLLCYLPLWDGRFPIWSRGPVMPHRGPALLWGLLAWLILVDAVRAAFMRSEPSPHPARADETPDRLSPRAAAPIPV